MIFPLYNPAAPTDALAHTDWQNRSSTQFDNQHRTISRRTYFPIPGTVGNALTSNTWFDPSGNVLQRKNQTGRP
jgi:hypothetical protein